MCEREISADVVLVCIDAPDTGGKRSVTSWVLKSPTIRTLGSRSFLSGTAFYPDHPSYRLSGRMLSVAVDKIIGLTEFATVDEYIAAYGPCRPKGKRLWRWLTR